MSDMDRLRVLAKFIRSQAMLTDGRTPRPGPGEVRLNHDAAILCADALDDYVAIKHKAVMFDELLPKLAALGLVT